MTNPTNATVESATTEVKKVKIGRGITTARGTTRLKFDHSMALPNGLFLTHVDEITVKDVTIGEDTSGMPSFNGMEVPRLNIVIASNEEDINKRKYITLTFMAQESNANTIPGGSEEWKINQIFDYLQHILKVFYLKGRDFTNEEAAMLSLPFEDFDEEGNYLTVDTEIVIAGWRQLFENFATMMNTGRDGKPVFKTKDNKIIPIYSKFLRAIKTKKGWQNVIKSGELSLPSFVGEGVFEIYKPNVAPVLRVNAVNESILPKITSSAKKPNMPNMPNISGGVPVGIPNAIQDPLQNPDGITMEAMEDSPF